MTTTTVATTTRRRHYHEHTSQATRSAHQRATVGLRQVRRVPPNGRPQSLSQRNHHAVLPAPATHRAQTATTAAAATAAAAAIATTADIVLAIKRAVVVVVRSCVVGFHGVLEAAASAAGGQGGVDHGFRGGGGGGALRVPRNESQEIRVPDVITATAAIDVVPAAAAPRRARMGSVQAKEQALGVGGV